MTGEELGSILRIIFISAGAIIGGYYGYWRTKKKAQNKPVVQ